MYVSNTDTVWTWKKQLTNFQQDVLHTLTFGASDTQIALIFQSKKIIVFDSNGNLIRAT